MDIFYLENRLKINSFDKILSLTDESCRIDIVVIVKMKCYNSYSKLTTL